MKMNWFFTWGLGLFFLSLPAIGSIADYPGQDKQSCIRQMQKRGLSPSTRADLVKRAQQDIATFSIDEILQLAATLLLVPSDLDTVEKNLRYLHTSDKLLGSVDYHDELVPLLLALTSMGATPPSEILALLDFTSLFHRKIWENRIRALQDREATLGWKRNIALFFPMYGGVVPPSDKE